jgi:hypothetical protein
VIEGIVGVMGRLVGIDGDQLHALGFEIVVKFDDAVLASGDVGAMVAGEHHDQNPGALEAGQGIVLAVDGG